MSRLDQAFWHDGVVPLQRVKSVEEMPSSVYCSPWYRGALMEKEGIFLDLMHVYVLEGLLVNFGTCHHHGK